REDEIDLADEDVPARELVDEVVQKRIVLRLQRVAAGRQRGDDDAVAKEERALVGVDRELTPERERLVRVLVDELVFLRVGPRDIVIVVSVLASSPDAAVAQTARATLEKLPSAVLAGGLTADLPGSVIEKLAEARPREEAVVLAVLKMPRVTTAALEHLASAA